MTARGPDGSRPPLAGLRVCILRAGPIEFDKRSRQVARSLVRNGASVKVIAIAQEPRQFASEDGYSVLEYSPGPASAHSVRVFRILANLWREARSVRRMVREVRAFGADAVHCMNVQTLLAGALVRRGSALVYDSREHFATTGDVSSTVRKWWVWQERRWVPRAAAVITVSQLIADDLHRRYGGPIPVVVYNGCPDRVEASIPAHSPLRLVHIGKAYADRHLDEVIDAVVAMQGRATLALQAWGETADALPGMIRERGGEAYVELLEPVAPDDIVQAIKGYDVGVHNIRPDTDSYRWTTANKLFEYIAAGLAVVLPDGLTESDRIVNEAACGIVFPPGEIRAAMSQLAERGEEATRLKANAVAASPMYSWAEQEAKLVDVYAAVALRTARPVVAETEGSR